MTAIDWSKAQDSDTHYDPMNRVFVNFDAMHDWDRKLIPRPTPPWPGDGLPPVGTTAVLDDECFPVFDDYRAMIGVPVVVTAAFKSPTGVDMIACALPGGLCGCFRADMARPIKTRAQIAAEEREAAVEAMWKIYWQPSATSAKQALGLLWDAGLRLPKGDDQ